jgi:hypothetical protein
METGILVLGVTQRDHQGAHAVEVKILSPQIVQVRDAVIDETIEIVQRFLVALIVTHGARIVTAPGLQSKTKKESQIGNQSKNTFFHVFLYDERRYEQKLYNTQRNVNLNSS